MNTQMKTIAVAIAAAVVVGGGSWAVASNMASPELVTVTQQGCGGPVNFAIPLQTAQEAAPGVGLTYGPIELTSATPVALSFRPGAATGREVTMADGRVELPTTFGNNNASPLRIRINCRDGAIANVRYERDRANTTFNVVRPVEAPVGLPQT